MSVCIDDACRLSHCVECDAHPGECSHGGARYLHPIAYERVEHEGKPAWRVPEYERARWDAGPIRGMFRPVDVETLSLEAILDALAPWYPSLELQARLAVAYNRDPARTSRLTTWTLAQSDERGPCGLLYVQLGKLDGET